MRRAVILSTLLSLPLLAACHEPDARTVTARTPVVSGNNELSWDMLRTMSSLEADTNQFYSPFSMVMALSMVMGGANGNTEAQLMSGLSVPEGGEAEWHASLGSMMEDLTGEHNRPYTLYSANRLWGQEGFAMKQDFLDLLENTYLAPLEQVDFGDDPEGIRQDINGWVADQTKDRIPELFAAGDINGDTRLALVNAIYFKADWAQSFEADATYDQPFFRLDGSSVDVPTMHHEDSYPYAALEDGLQVLELPYEGGDLGMVVLLPETGEDLDALIAGLDDARVEALLGEMSTDNKVRVGLPSFELSYDLPLRDALEALGMSDMFDDGLADFSGITEETRLVVQAARHKAFVRVDEEGTEAAAATGISMGETSAPIDPVIEVNADRPFVYAIRDRLTGSVLFVGRMMDPSEAPLQD